MFTINIRKRGVFSEKLVRYPGKHRVRRHSSRK